MSRPARVTIELTKNAIAEEYRAIDEGLRRCQANVERFDPTPYDPRAVERARAMWSERMAVEHRSTSVFSELAAQLLEANATIDAKVVVLRMAQDELRHTITCGEVVRALGGTPAVDVDVSVEPLARHRGCSAEEVALRNVLYTTSLSEMIAVARLVDERDRTVDPFLRDATRRLLADEVLHGQFGFLYLEAWKPWLEAHGEVARSLERYLVHAFAVLESALAGSGRGRTLTTDERALGLPDAEPSRAIFYETIEHAIVPGLARLGLDAETSWRTRKRLA